MVCDSLNIFHILDCMLQVVEPRGNVTEAVSKRNSTKVDFEFFENCPPAKIAPCENCLLYVLDCFMNYHCSYSFGLLVGIRLVTRLGGYFGNNSHKGCGMNAPSM